MLCSKLSSKGQVTIPLQVREKLGAKPGDIILYDVHGNGVKLRRIEPFDAAFHAALSQTLAEGYARRRRGISRFVNNGM